MSSGVTVDRFAALRVMLVRAREAAQPIELTRYCKYCGKDQPAAKFHFAKCGPCRNAHRSAMRKAGRWAMK